MDKVSVIVPIYKVEKYLRQCLDSIVNQTYRNLEIILVDDGSPDNCGSICDEYAKKDNRIIVIHKNNGGLCAARNDGIQRATGDWIAFVDSDDWCELDYYEKMLKAAQGLNVDLVISGGFIKDYPYGREIVHTFEDSFQYTDTDNIQRLMKDIIHLGMPWDKLYSRMFILKNKIAFDVTCKAFEDFYFNFQAFDKSAFVIGEPIVCYHYRQAATSIANGFNPEKPKINYDFVSRLISYVNERGLDDAMAPTVSAVAILAILVAMVCYYFHPANSKSWRVIAGEIKEMKTWPYYHEAIYSPYREYLTKKQVILKYVLRLPWVWPIKLLYAGKSFWQHIKDSKNRG